MATAGLTEKPHVVPWRPRWNYRHSKMLVPEWTLDLGMARRRFWLIIGAGHHRYVIDYFNTRKAERGRHRG